MFLLLLLRLRRRRRRRLWWGRGGHDERGLPRLGVQRRRGGFCSGLRGGGGGGRGRGGEEGGDLALLPHERGAAVA